MNSRAWTRDAAQLRYGTALLGGEFASLQDCSGPVMDQLDRIREDRIHNEAIVDAYGPEERAIGWYYFGSPVCKDCASPSRSWLVR
jgi:hypothetical protein